MVTLQVWVWQLSNAIIDKILRLIRIHYHVALNGIAPESLIYDLSALNHSGFVCDDGTVTITIEKKCDNIPDCKDNTDELNCGMFNAQNLKPEHCLVTIIIEWSYLTVIDLNFISSC